MILEHLGKRPTIHETATIAPNAVLCGDVSLGAHCRVLFGAVLTAEGGPIVVGDHCIIMENAVIRGTKRHPTHLGDHVLVGPRAYLSGCTVEESAFLATGATVFNGAHIGTRSEVRINGVVHLRTTLPPDTLVPIGWVAVGDPAGQLPVLVQRPEHPPVPVKNQTRGVSDSMGARPGLSSPRGGAVAPNACSTSRVQ